MPKGSSRVPADVSGLGFPEEEAPIEGVADPGVHMELEGTVIDVDELKKSTKVPVLTVISNEPHVLVGSFVGAAPSDIQKAFAHEEKLVNGVRKLPKSEWKKLYDAFLKAPR